MALKNLTEGSFPKVIANLDITSILQRMDRIYTEVSLCQSADMPNGLLDSDKARFLDYLADFKAELDYVISRPIPDSPEAHGLLTWAVPSVEDFRDPDDCENDDISQILKQIIVYRIEVSNAQSNRLVQGFIPVPVGHPGDIVRMRDGYQRLLNLINFVSTTQPSDRPESTPREMPTGPGRLGTGTAATK